MLHLQSDQVDCHLILTAVSICRIAKQKLVGVEEEQLVVEDVNVQHY